MSSKWKTQLYQCFQAQKNAAFAHSEYTHANKTGFLKYIMG